MSYAEHEGRNIKKIRSEEGTECDTHYKSERSFEICDENGEPLECKNPHSNEVYCKEFALPCGIKLKIFLTRCDAKAWSKKGGDRLVDDHLGSLFYALRYPFDVDYPYIFRIYMKTENDHSELNRRDHLVYAIRGIECGRNNWRERFQARFDQEKTKVREALQFSIREKYKQLSKQER